MKIAIFSDIHGNLQALRAILQDAQEERVDKMICLGDVIAIGPNSKECLDLIINYNITLLLGNHELYFLRGLENVKGMSEQENEHQKYIRGKLYGHHYDFLEKCPINLTINYKNHKIVLSHFLIENINREDPFYPLSILNDDYNEVLLNNGAEYIFIGHQHRAFKKSIDNVNLIDVGSAGCRKDEITSYYILELKNDIKVEEKRINFNREELINTFEEINYPDKEFISEKFFGIKEDY